MIKLLDKEIWALAASGIVLGLAFAFLLRMALEILK